MNGFFEWNFQNAIIFHSSFHTIIYIFYLLNSLIFYIYDLGTIGALSTNNSITSISTLSFCSDFRFWVRKIKTLFFTDLVTSIEFHGWVAQIAVSVKIELTPSHEFGGNQSKKDNELFQFNAIIAFNSSDSWLRTISECRFIDTQYLGLISKFSTKSIFRHRYGFRRSQ